MVFSTFVERKFLITLIARIIGIAIGLSLVLQTRHQEKLARSGKMLGARYVLLPFYKPVLVMCLFTIALEILSSASYLYLTVPMWVQSITWLAFELPRGSFATLFLQKSIAKSALRRGLCYATIWPLTGIFFGLMVTVDKKNDLIYCISYHAISVLFHLYILIAARFPALPMSPRDAIVPFSLYMFFYRLLWVVFYCLLLGDVSVNEMLFYIPSSVCDVVFPVLLFAVVRADSYYWQFGNAWDWLLRRKSGYLEALQALEEGGSVSTQVLAHGTITHPSNRPGASANNNNTNSNNKSAWGPYAQLADGTGTRGSEGLAQTASFDHADYDDSDASNGHNANYNGSQKYAHSHRSLNSHYAGAKNNNNGGNGNNLDAALLDTHGGGGGGGLERSESGLSRSKFPRSQSGSYVPPIVVGSLPALGQNTSNGNTGNNGHNAAAGHANAPGKKQFQGLPQTYSGHLSKKSSSKSSRDGSVATGSVVSVVAHSGDGSGGYAKGHGKKKSLNHVITDYPIDPQVAAANAAASAAANGDDDGGCGGALCGAEAECMSLADLDPATEAAAAAAYAAAHPHDESGVAQVYGGEMVSPSASTRGMGKCRLICAKANSITPLPPTCAGNNSINSHDKAIATSDSANFGSIGSERVKSPTPSQIVSASGSAKAEAKSCIFGSKSGTYVSLSRSK